MALSQALQSLQGVDNLQEIGFGVGCRPVGRHLLNHKIAHSTPVEVGDIVMTVILLCLQREE